MKLYRKISVLAMAALVLAAGFTSCSEDDLDTNQYNKSGVNILGFGPMPITRGATMRVTGTQLNQVKEVLFPEGNQKLTPATTYVNGDFSVQSSEEMTVTIPDQCVPGKLRLVTNNGETIVSASNITFVEEIKVSSMSPDPVHPGDVLKEEIESRGISQKKFAELLSVPYTQLNEILNGKRPVSSDFALMVEAALGINPMLLINMQNRYNMAIAQQKPALIERMKNIRKACAAMW